MTEFPIKTPNFCKLKCPRWCWKMVLHLWHISLPPGCVTTCAGKVVNKIRDLIQAKNNFTFFLFKKKQLYKWSLPSSFTHSYGKRGQSKGSADTHLPIWQQQQQLEQLVKQPLTCKYHTGACRKQVITSPVDASLGSCTGSSFYQGKESPKRKVRNKHSWQHVVQTKLSSFMV